MPKRKPKAEKSRKDPPKFVRRKDPFTIYFEPADSSEPGLKLKDLDKLMEIFDTTMQARCAQLGVPFKSSKQGFILSLIEHYGETFAKEGPKPK